MSPGGILYSFRRCPYAIRARLALAELGVAVEVREVALRAKPPELFEASPKGTVPVWLRTNETPRDESLAILLWALAQNPARRGQEQTLSTGAPAALIAECDGPFKHHLDGFRYGPSGQMEHQRACFEILRRWSQTLEAMAQADQPTATCLEPLGWAVLPFVRQCRLTDREGFAQEPGLEALKGWLAAFEAGPALARVMAPPWAWRQPWRSPRWLYHLALEAEWQAARRQGVYARSTRGLSLAEVGFLHASFSHQVEATWRRFYSDGPELRLLVIDPARLETAGIPLRVEPAPGSGELFPHLYGALPVEAVLLAERFTPEGGLPLP
jgi:glutathione S-transferase